MFDGPAGSRLSQLCLSSLRVYQGRASRMPTRVAPPELSPLQGIRADCVSSLAVRVIREAVRVDARLSGHEMRLNGRRIDGNARFDTQVERIGGPGVSLSARR